MNSLLQITKSYFFCDYCGKCYIYKNSYEKHNKICSKKLESMDPVTIMNDDITLNKNNIINHTINHTINHIHNNNDKYIVDYNHIKYNQHEQLVEIICPIYLFLLFLTLGFIKGIFVSF